MLFEKTKLNMNQACVQVGKEDVKTPLKEVKLKRGGFRAVTERDIEIIKHMRKMEVEWRRRMIMEFNESRC